MLQLKWIFTWTFLLSKIFQTSNPNPNFLDTFVVKMHKHTKNVIKFHCFLSLKQLEEKKRYLTFVLFSTRFMTFLLFAIIREPCGCQEFPIIKKHNRNIDTFLQNEMLNVLYSTTSETLYNTKVSSGINWSYIKNTYAIKPIFDICKTALPHKSPKWLNVLSKPEVVSLIYILKSTENIDVWWFSSSTLCVYIFAMKFKIYMEKSSEISNFLNFFCPKITNFVLKNIF